MNELVKGRRYKRKRMTKLMDEGMTDNGIEEWVMNG